MNVTQKGVKSILSNMVEYSFSDNSLICDLEKLWHVRQRLRHLYVTANVIWNGAITGRPSRRKERWNGTSTDRNKISCLSVTRAPYEKIVFSL